MKRTPLNRKTPLKSVHRCKHKPCKVVVNRAGVYCSPECKAKVKKAVKRGQINKKKLDTLWSKLVRERDGKCLYCGSTENLQAHHIYSRVSYTTRWVLGNGITLCFTHHLGHQFSPHKTPIEFTDWIREKLGAEILEELRRESRLPNTQTMEEWHEELTRQP